MNVLVSSPYRVVCALALLVVLAPVLMCLAAGMAGPAHDCCGRTPAPAPISPTCCLVQGPGRATLVVNAANVQTIISPGASPAIPLPAGAAGDIASIASYQSPSPPLSSSVLRI